MARQESLVTRSRAGCMIRCKMTQGRVTEMSCLLDLTISLRLSLAMSEQSLKKMGFSWASWINRMAKSIVVRFVVRKWNLMKNMEERLMASGHPVSWWTVTGIKRTSLKSKPPKTTSSAKITEVQRRQMLKFAASRHNCTVQNLWRFLFIKKSPFTPFPFSLSPTRKTKQSLSGSFVTPRCLPEKVQAATNDSDVCGLFAFRDSHTMTLASLGLLQVATFYLKRYSTR